jgi:hypothetical protein
MYLPITDERLDFKIHHRGPHSTAAHIGTPRGVGSYDEPDSVYIYVPTSLLRRQLYGLPAEIEYIDVYDNCTGACHKV